MLTDELIIYTDFDENEILFDVVSLFEAAAEDGLLQNTGS